MIEPFRDYPKTDAEAYRLLDRAMRLLDLIAYQAEEAHIRQKADEGRKEIRKFLSP